MACRTAATPMSDAEISTLNTLLDQHAKQINAANGQQYLQNDGDFDFHYLIAQGSQNQLLIDLLSGELYQLLRMCRFRTAKLAERTTLALQQHRHIMEAIAAHDGELAELLMRRHISGAWKTIRKLMDENK
jgi:DNA-binding GntR family transcriptional regulator